MDAELNRETKYFDAMVRLFDLHLENNQLTGACEALEKLVDIDPYDSRNQQRMDLIQGRADPGFMSRLNSRLAGPATHRSQTPPQERPPGTSHEPSSPTPHCVRPGHSP